MTVEEWFFSRHLAYEEFRAVEEDPEADEDEIAWAWARFAEIRKLLNLWKRSEPIEWRNRWTEVQLGRIGGIMQDLADECRQPRLEEG